MTVDITQLASLASSGVFAFLGFLITGLINAHIKNQAARVAVDGAVGHSIGALQQAVDAEIGTKLLVPIPGVPPALLPAVQYVIDQEPAALAQLGITPESLAAKVDARLGLAKLAAAVPPPSPAPTLPIVTTLGTRPA